MLPRVADKQLSRSGQMKLMFADPWLERVCYFAQRVSSGDEVKFGLDAVRAPVDVGCCGGALTQSASGVDGGWIARDRLFQHRLTRFAGARACQQPVAPS